MERGELIGRPAGAPDKRPSGPKRLSLGANPWHSVTGDLEKSP